MIVEQSEKGPDAFLTGFENLRQLQAVAKLINQKAMSGKKKAVR